MTELYLIRHVQAEGNLYRMMQGFWDGGITEQGRREAAALGKRFDGCKLDGVVASDLYRARFTASALSSPRGLELQTSPRLRELDVGPWQCAFYGDVLHSEQEKMLQFMYDSEKWQVEGAETFLQVGKRGLAELTDLARRYEGGSVAVVSHGITIRSTLSEITGIPLSDTGRLPICGNTAVTRLQYEDGSFRMLSFNDCSHLEGIPRWDNKAPSFRGEFINPKTEADWYCGCYADAWTAAHASLQGFRAEPYLSSALEHYRTDPKSLIKLWDGDTPAGLVELDTARGAHAGIGWISLLYLTEDYRGRGCGIQALARAIMYYSRLGRKCIRLHVAKSNTAAQNFYAHWGFRELSREDRAQGRLLLLERSLVEERLLL